MAGPASSAGLAPTRAPRPAGNHGRPAPRVRVLIVNPDPAAREALRHTLEGLGISDIVTASGDHDLTSVIAGDPVDVTLVTVPANETPGDLIRQLRRAGSRVLALASHTDVGTLTDALHCGATGVVVGSGAATTARPQPPFVSELSSREVEVIGLVADGQSNKEIGARLDLSALTVKSHLARIGRKLGTGDRAHIVALALRAGVI